MPSAPETLKSSAVISQAGAEDIFRGGDSVRAEIARLHLRTKRSLNTDIIGQYRTAFHGQGLLFSDLREYQPGDDIKNIHWKASARTGKFYVKSFEEERELRIMLAVDISRSTNFGRRKSNFQKALEFASAVTLLAEAARDSIGLCLFSDAVHEFIPPAKTRFNFHKIVETLCDNRPFAAHTDLCPMLAFLNEKFKKHLVVFIISDFLARPFLEPLKVLALRHDVIMVGLLDEVELRLPRAGLVAFQDPELGDRVVVDTSDPRAPEMLKKFQTRRMGALSALSKQARTDFILVHDNPVRPLVELLQERIRRIR